MKTIPKFGYLNSFPVMENAPSFDHILNSVMNKCAIPVSYSKPLPYVAMTATRYRQPKAVPGSAASRRPGGLPLGVCCDLALQVSSNNVLPVRVGSSVDRELCSVFFFCLPFSVFTSLFHVFCCFTHFLLLERAFKFCKLWVTYVRPACDDGCVCRGSVCVCDNSIHQSIHR